MAVSDGQRVNAQVTNAAYISRTQDSDTVAVVGLNHPSSGGLIANAQQKINDNTAEIQSNDTDIADLQLNKEDKANKGVANGYAELDATGKVPVGQIPDKFASIEGNWDASTNTPTLADGVGNLGEIYVVNVAGTQDLGSGSQTFELGDWVIYNSANEWIKVINSTAVTSVNSQTGAVVLDLDDINDVNVGTPGPSDDQKAVIWDNASGEFQLGTTIGTGAGGINYVTNTDAELTADNHVTYDDGVTDVPIDGDGGVAGATSVTRTTTASEILRGSGSFKLAKGAGDGQGEGVHIGLDPIDPRDKETRLRVSFDYKMPSGTSIVDGNYRVFIYDVDNATLIGAVENDDDGDILVHTGEGATFAGWFNATDSLNYRLLIHTTDTDVTVREFYYDNVKLGPADSFTPATAVNTIETKILSADVTSDIEMTDLTYSNLEIGKWYEVEGQFLMTLDSGASNDAVVVSASHDGNVIGRTNFNIEETGDTSPDAIFGNIHVKFQATSNTLIFSPLSASSSSFINGNGTQTETFVQLETRNDLSTNAVSNTQLTQSSVKASGADNVGTSITASVTDIDFTETSDPLNAWDGSGFTAPKDGLYTARGSTYWTASLTGFTQSYIDGVLDKDIGNPAGSTNTHFFDWVGFLQKGQRLSIRHATGGTLNTGIPRRHWIEVHAHPDFESYGVVNPNTEYLESTDSTVRVVGGPSLGTWFVPAGSNWTIPLTEGTWDIFVKGYCQATTSTTSGSIDTEISLSNSLTPGSGLIGTSFTGPLYQQGTRNAEAWGYHFSVLNYTVSSPEDLYVHVKVNNFSGAANVSALQFRHDRATAVLAARRVK